MADLKVYVAEDNALGANQAIGFFGEGQFGSPIALNGYNGRTFVTNLDGSSEGLESDNCKYKSSTEVIVGQTGSGILLTELPNYLSTMNIRFTHDFPVMVNNVSFNVYDGYNIVNPPSGLTCYAAEIRHTALEQTDTGDGDASWVEIGGSAATLGLSESPGISGTFPPSFLDSRHDWFVALSVKPTYPGDKQFAFAVDLLYL